MEIKYRGGVPTRKSMVELMDSYKPNFSGSFVFNVYYGRILKRKDYKDNNQHGIHWRNTFMNTEVPPFIQYAKGHGVEIILDREWEWKDKVSGMMHVKPVTIESEKPEKYYPDPEKPILEQVDDVCEHFGLSHDVKLAIKKISSNSYIQGSNDCHKILVKGE